MGSKRSGKGKCKRQGDGGGILVRVKKGKRIKEIEEWKYGLLIKEVNIEKGKKLNIIVIYNNKGMKEMTEELRELINDIIVEGCTIIVIANFNARTGK